MSWFAGIFCFIITAVTLGCMEDRRQEAARKKMLSDIGDLIEFSNAVFRHTGYYELKRDREHLMEILFTKGAKLPEIWMSMLLKTLHYIDDGLAKFSDEEKAIYDAIYRETA